MEIPNLSGYNYRQGNRVYRYVYVGERVTKEDGTTTHPKAKMIGCVIDSAQGQKLLPNEFYYELMQIPAPASGRKEGPGRKAQRNKPESMAESSVTSSVKSAEKTAASSYVSGYGLCVATLARQLKLDYALQCIFGAERGSRLLALAAYLCAGQHSSLYDLGNFVDSEFAGIKLMGVELTGHEAAGSEGDVNQGDGNKRDGNEGSGFESAWLESAGFESAGSEGVGLENSGLESSRLESAATRSTGTFNSGEDSWPGSWSDLRSETTPESLPGSKSQSQSGSYLGRSEVEALLESLKTGQCRSFYAQWLEDHPHGELILYDLTSFCSYSGQIIQPYLRYNRDISELVQLNEGLFCDLSSGLPLMALSYYGSLNERANFKHALAAAREAGLDTGDRRRLTVVTDGVFRESSFNLGHFKDCSLIAAVSCERLKVVREAYLKWVRSLTEADRDKEWILNERSYISSQVELSLGGLDGVLMLYRDLEQEVNQRAQLAERRKSKEQELKDTGKAPAQGFAEWAESFRPFFKVSRIPNGKGFSYEFDKDAYAQAHALCGKLTLFVVKREGKLSEQEALACYRAKEALEESFDTTRNGLCDQSLHVSGDPRGESRRFVMVIALILRQTIESRLKGVLNKHDLSFEEAIAALRRVRVRREGQGLRLKEAAGEVEREIIGSLLICEI